MPYIAEESRIITKVMGVATKINPDDNVNVRQVILEDIAEEPLIVDLIYLKKEEVWVKLNDGKEYHLGYLKKKYLDIIMKNACQIKSFQITGGQEIPRGKLNLGGYDGNIGKPIRAKRGMNITINLL